MKRLLKFRDGFWLVLVVALAVGWWIDRSNSANERDKLRARLRDYYGEGSGGRYLPLYPGDRR